MPYSAEQIEQVHEALNMWTEREHDLSVKLVLHEWKSARGREFAVHGLNRRLAMLRHCIERLFELLPMDAAEPSRTDILDATALLQSFVINVFGAIENMAHVWCNEIDLRMPNGNPLPWHKIGFSKKYPIVRDSLPAAFIDHLNEAADWYGNLESYRHSLAHRIALYIPPKTMDMESRARFMELDAEITAATGDMERTLQLRGEQNGLGTFQPVIMHSFLEGDVQPIRFHPQMICDYSTVIELGEKFVEALEGL